MEKWYIINEKIFNLEKKIESEGETDELKKEWDELVIYSRKIAGCIIRKTYGEKIKEE